MPHEVVIGLGSNIDPEANLEQAVKELESRFKVSKRSQWTQTKPIGIQDQPDFYNGALLMETELEQQSLKKELKRIEDILGYPRFVSIPFLGFVAPTRFPSIKHHCKNPVGLGYRWAWSGSIGFVSTP